MISLSMNAQIREATRIAMLRQDVSQKDIAQRLSISRQHLSRMLRGHVDGSVQTWLRLLDEVGLELTVHGKDRQ